MYESTAPGNINAGEGAYMCDATGIEACTNLRYLNLSGKRPDQTRCKQQQTARYARLFNQYSSEKIYVSQNKNLLQLHCYACSLEIERWDLSANPELKDLRIGGDGYVAFDKVSILDCSNNHSWKS